MMIASLFLLSLAFPVKAFWIFTHRPLLQTRLDPIMDSSRISQHVHNVAGSSAFSQDYDYNRTLEANCTTATVQEDRSMYWTPQLYFHAENGSFTAVETFFINTYYLARNGPNNNKIHAFPAGLRMLAGDQDRKTYNATSFSDQAVSYVCLDSTTSHTGDPAWEERPDFFEHNCPSGMRAQVMFPSCWNGVDLDSEDHRSHMSYPIQTYNGGDCPTSHPVQLVTLFYEWIYSVQNYPYHGPGSWVWSNGDTTGLGFHGDFASGWAAGPDSLLQRAIDTCPENMSGQDSCVPENFIVDESIGTRGTWITKLPGPNLIDTDSTPAKAKFERIGFVEKAELVSAIQPVPEGWSARPNLSNSTAMTPAFCIAHCQSQGLSVAGLALGEQCFCDSEFDEKASKGTSPIPAICDVFCPGTEYTFCGGRSALSIFSVSSAFLISTVNSTSPSLSHPNSTSLSLSNSTSLLLGNSTSASGQIIISASSNAALAAAIVPSNSSTSAFSRCPSRRAVARHLQRRRRSLSLHSH